MSAVFGCNRCSDGETCYVVVDSINPGNIMIPDICPFSPSVKALFKKMTGLPKSKSRSVPKLKRYVT